MGGVPTSVLEQQPRRRQRFVYRHAAGNQLLKRLSASRQVDVVQIEAESHVGVELRGQFVLDLARQRYDNAQVPLP